MTPVLSHREWLIQPEALQFMAASIDEVVGRGDGFPTSVPDSDLLSVDDGRILILT